MKPGSSRPQPEKAAGKLRIIGGSLRGSKLAVADLDGLRPTPDRVRETLFNWLASFIEGARCLDLFAGTGALGIEALSRGASWVDFIERDAQLAQTLRGNLSRLKQEAARVRNADALSVLGEKPEQPFDIAFVDPPFALNLWDSAAGLLESSKWLAPHALIYVESPVEQALNLPPTWQPHREGRASAVRYALYRRSDKLTAR